MRITILQIIPNPLPLMDTIHPVCYFTLTSYQIQLENYSLKLDTGTTKNLEINELPKIVVSAMSTIIIYLNVRINIGSMV